MKRGYLFGTTGGGIAFSALMLLYIFVAFLGGLILTACGLKQTDGAYVMISAIFPALSIVAVTFYFSVSRGEGYFSLTGVNAFNPLYLLFALFVAFGVFCGFGFINEYTASLIAKTGLNANAITYTANSGIELAVFIFFYALLPAVTEEIFFRGLILNSFKGVKNLAVAVVLSGLCFALYHVNFTQFFYQFIYGVMLALLVVVSGSVIPAIFAHFINNLAVILFTYFAVEINLFSPLFISLGIIVTVLSALALIFLNKKKSAEKSEKTDGAGKFILFAAVGGAFCLLLAMGNLFNI